MKKNNNKKDFKDYHVVFNTQLTKEMEMRYFMMHMGIETKPRPIIITDSIS